MHRTSPPLLASLLTTSFVATLMLGCCAWIGCGGGGSEPAETDSAGVAANDSPTAPAVTPEVTEDGDENTENANPPATEEVATFGSGCFWCTEAILDRMEGVHEAVSGYMGGSVENPSYKMVCTGRTGHAEVVQVTFNPAVVAYEDLLQAFWKTHDPTTLNRQGNDIGTQYRSVVFYHSDEQRQIAEHYKKRLEEEGAFSDPIVTEISEAAKFYPAEEDHQDYFARNPNEGYCEFVIAPKVEKFKKAFGEKLKSSSK